MKSHKPFKLCSITDMHAPNRIIVFRNGSIGNTLAALPAIRCLRASFPSTHITVVVDKIGQELLANCPYCDTTVVYDRGGRDKGLFGFLRTARRLRLIRPDTAILFKRFYRNGLLARLSGAKRRVGFVTNGAAPFLNETIAYDESIHVAELNLQLVKQMGAGSHVPLLPDLSITQAERNEAERWLQNNVIGGPYVVVHFGGITSGTDFVTTSLRVKLLQKLASHMPKVIIGNGPLEQQAARALIREVKDSVDATGLNMRLTMALIAQAKRFVGTNSGPMHIAAAAQVAGIALFKGDNRYNIERVKWKPLFDGLKVVPVYLDADPDSVIENANNLWPIE